MIFLTLLVSVRKHSKTKNVFYCNLSIFFNPDYILEKRNEAWKHNKIWFFSSFSIASLWLNLKK